MAKTSSSGKKSGVAIEKRAKMDKAQQDILSAVCLAAAVVGFTIVGSIFMIKKIGYNNKLITAQEKIIKVYKQTQASLRTLESSLSNLATDEYLKSVAVQRSSDKASCANYTDITDIHNIEGAELENVKRCSSLRVIADSLPATETPNMPALLSSLEYLVDVSNGGDGVFFESLGELSNSGQVKSYGFSQAKNDRLHVMGSSVVFNDNSSKIYSALNSIEQSVRNFDILNARFEWGSGDLMSSDKIKLTSNFASYYLDPLVLDEEEIVVCADPESEKCQKKGGDTMDKEKKKSSSSSSSSSTSEKGAKK